MDDIEIRLIRCFSALFPELSTEQILTMAPANATHWDSVATVTLFAMIEEEFCKDINLEGEDLSFAALNTSLHRSSESPLTESGTGNSESVPPK